MAHSISPKTKDVSNFNENQQKRMPRGQIIRIYATNCAILSIINWLIHVALVACVCRWVWLFAAQALRIRHGGPVAEKINSDESKQHLYERIKKIIEKCNGILKNYWIFEEKK